MKQNLLVGKKLIGIEIAKDRQAIRFLIDGGEVVAKCDGDCCSYTWVENIELPAYGLPQLVVSVEDLNMPDGLASLHQENTDVVSYYGCKIVLAQGEIVIDYRNDSNGYYGGNLAWPDDSYFYGGVHGQNVSKEEWEPVK